MRQGPYFLVNILAVLFSISGGSETNSKFGWVVGWVGGMDELTVKLSAINQVEVEVKAEFDKIMMILNWFLNLQIY